MKQKIDKWVQSKHKQRTAAESIEWQLAGADVLAGMILGVVWAASTAWSEEGSTGYGSVENAGDLKETWAQEVVTDVKNAVTNLSLLSVDADGACQI